MVSKKLNILVTGAKGFIGKNLIVALREKAQHNILQFDIENNHSELEAYLKSADFIFHLAGVNRPQDESEFQAVNVGFTKKLIEALCSQRQKTPILFSSSIQVNLENSYGKSKKEAELLLGEYSKKTGARVIIYRLKNVFGKWCRPNYNSAVATFCYNISRNLPIAISDANNLLDLVYIDDVINAFVKEIESKDIKSFLYREVQPNYVVILGKLAEILGSFKGLRKELLLPDFSDEFVNKLYATYLSYLDPQDFPYMLEKKLDSRGYLAEFLKAKSFGQIFISSTLPGVTRGNHYHDTKAEKFLVVEGEGVVSLRDMRSSKIAEYKVNGLDLRVIDIPPGYTHSIKNTGSGNLITLFWSSQILDSDNTDTYGLNVVLDNGESEGV